MPYLIDNNNFSNDSYGVRETRLYFIKNSIDTYSTELSIEDDLLTWATSAYDAFNTARIKQSAEIGEKYEAFQTSQKADIALAERYQILKDILISRYPDDDDKLKVYGITPNTPKTHAERIEAAENLIEGNSRELNTGYGVHPHFTEPIPTLALPSDMITNFTNLVNSAKETFFSAGVERRQSEEATAALNTIYDADSKKLRELYNWIIAHWGKYDPRLIDFGFVTANDNTGGTKPPVPVNLSYNAAGHILKWDIVEVATSYQLVYRETGSDNEWVEIYSGDLSESNLTLEPANWTLKVRARNSNGYGDWSISLDLSIVEPYLNAPTDIAFYIDNMMISWSEVENATNYSIELSQDNLEFNEAFSGAETHFIYQPTFEGMVYVRARARNSSAFSSYSEVYTFSYFSTLPPPEGLTISFLSETTGLIRLNFEEVASATTYKIFRSVVGVGLPAIEFIYITEQSGTEYIGNTIEGMRNYYQVKAGNATQLSAASTAVFIDMAVIP